MPQVTLKLNDSEDAAYRDIASRMGFTTVQEWIRETLTARATHAHEAFEKGRVMKLRNRKTILLDDVVETEGKKPSK